MDVLLHGDVVTGEPVGVWFEGSSGTRECLYSDASMEDLGAESVVEDYPPHLPWTEICDRLSRSSQYFARWSWLTEVADPGDELEKARRRWVGVSASTTSSRWIAEARRERFRHRHA